MITSTSPRYSVSAISMPAISAPRIGERPTLDGRQAGDDHHQQADGEEQLGALGPRRLGEQRRQDQPPGEQHARPTTSAADQHGSEQAIRRRRRRVRRHRAEQRRRSGTSARSSNSSIASAARPTGLWCPTIGSTSAVEDMRQREAERDRAGSALAHQQQPDADQIAAEPISSAAPTPNTSWRIDHSRRKRQLEPDREQQQDDAELGERLDRLGVGDGDVVQPRIAVRSARPAPNGPDQHADEDEADDRA